MTIAVSTIISAINALTMTPSRAVLIFKTEQSGTGHEHRREALPWWIFGVLGGAAHRLAAARSSLAGLLGLPAPAAGEDAGAGVAVVGRLTAAISCPGRWSAALLGWLIIRPVNAVLGWLFRGFNRALRPDHRRSTAGRSAGVLRLSVVVLLVYGGLLVLTVLAVRPHADRLHPAAGQGLSVLNVQLPDSASVERTQRVHGPHRDSWPATRRGSSTRSASPASR